MSSLVVPHWDRCRAWLLPAMVDTGEDQVLALLASGQASLWPGKQAAMVTQLIRGPDELFAHVWLGGGRLRELLELQPGAEAWARMQGAISARINGRAGWARVLRKRGFEPYGDELRKVL